MYIYLKKSSKSNTSSNLFINFDVNLKSCLKKKSVLALKLSNVSLAFRSWQVRHWRCRSESLLKSSVHVEDFQTSVRLKRWKALCGLCYRSIIHRASYHTLHQNCFSRWLTADLTHANAFSTTKWRWDAFCLYLGNHSHIALKMSVYRYDFKF